MDWILLVTVKPRVNKPLFNAVVGITNDFLYPNSSKIYDKKTSIMTKLRYSEQILSLPLPFDKSRFHCIILLLFVLISIHSVVSK